MESKTLLLLILGITALIAAILGIVPLALTGVGNAGYTSQFQCYVAMDIIGIIVLIAGAILAFILACKDIYHSYPIIIALAVIIPLGLLAYIIANACYWPKVTPSPGSWLLSAMWAAVPPALTALIYVCVRPDRVL
ncbi:unnamed protein product [Echinostoma caproni]|uniref:Uncharacterized protein n=1 Tax=Echinostoma caproni TaxID=27848 RepID=A0A183AFA7_9TREM|nr:unnamed protein product [Echinostoma caproni]